MSLYYWKPFIIMILVVVGAVFVIGWYTGTIKRTTRLEDAVASFPTRTEQLQNAEQAVQREVVQKQQEFVRKQTARAEAEKQGDPKKATSPYLKQRFIGLFGKPARR